jgi:hypothetical protein
LFAYISHAGSEKIHRLEGECYKRSSLTHGDYHTPRKIAAIKSITQSGFVGPRNNGVTAKNELASDFDHPAGDGRHDNHNRKKPVAPKV